MPSVYYIIRDGGSIRAIHKIPDSATECYNRIVASSMFQGFVSLAEMLADDYGVIVNTRIMKIHYAPMPPASPITEKLTIFTV